jgi:hypothetical protein
VRPRIAARTAVRTALAAALGQPAARTARLQRLTGVKPRLTILAEGRPRLVYKVMLPLSLNPRGRWQLVDARSGAYIGWRPGGFVHGGPAGVQP